MRKLRIIPFLLILCLAFSLLGPTAYALDDPEIAAEAIVLADFKSGNILYEKNMNDARSPASLTKIMTGLLAVEAVEKGTVKLDQVITAGEDCRQGLEEDSSTAGIYPGEQMTFEDLMYCAMVVSANEACNIIGTAVSGSIQNFVNEMNRRARELGCTNTLFSDTNGLINEDHYTSAHDLFMITREAMTHPKFVTLVTAKYYVVPATNVSPERELNSSNALMTPDGIYGKGYEYDGAAGVKTGFTKRAGYCLVSTASRDNRQLIAIVLGCRGPLANNPQNDYGNFSQSIKLYDWGFENFSYRTILQAGQAVKEESVSMAKEGTTVVLRPDSDITLLLPNDIKETDIDIRVKLNRDTLEAPLAEDEVLGSAEVYIKGSKYSEVNLITFDAVQAYGFAKIKAALSSFFSAPWLKIVLIVLAAALVIYIILMIRFRIARRKHLKQRMAAAEKRKAQRDRRNTVSATRMEDGSGTPSGTPAQHARPEQPEDRQESRTAIIRDDSIPAPKKYETLEPSQRQDEQVDLDELLKSLGLDKYD